MKVRDLVAQLKAAYADDDELVVAYWDRDTVASYAGLTLPLTSDEWSAVVDLYEAREFGWQGYAAEALNDLVEEILDDPSSV